MVGAVLVVDEQPDVRQIAVSLLERIGYRTMAAADGAQALAMVQSKASQILWILRDWTMPGLYGAELLSALRALRADIPIVVMSLVYRL